MFYKYLPFFSDQILDQRIQNHMLSTPRLKWYVLSSGILIILCWQLFFALTPMEHLSEYGRQDASGFSHLYAKHFTYFYYYLDLFPVTTSRESLGFSKEDAENEITSYGDSLLMEWGHWSRLGEHTRILLYSPGNIISGSPENPTIIPFNSILFILVLIGVFISFWEIKMPVLGFLIALFFGSSPFLIYEIYNNENIFGLMICVTLLVMAINLHLFKRPSSNKYIWLLPIITGLIMATAMNIRSESTVIIGSCLFIYLLIPNLHFRKKLLFCFLLLTTIWIGKKGWLSYFDKKYQEAYEIVEKAGGNPYNGLRSTTHNFWHPFFCGLGDFDTKYGYAWDDRMAYGYAIPILKEKYDLDLKWSNNLMLDEYYDIEKKYYKKLELFLEYTEVIKEKVLHDIKNDPFWYLNIIRKRLFHIFSDTSPVWITFGNYHLNIPINGFLIIPFILFLFYKRRWFELKILLFSFPLATTSLLIFAKKNTTFNSCFHLFLSALIIAWIIEWIIIIIRKKKIGDLSSINDE